ncbi:MAG: DPP IV N-terminal domain-containing protein [Planctomycetaceae bacterium]
MQLRFFRPLAFLLSLVVLWQSAASTASADEFRVTAPPAELKVDPFHKKYVDVGGYPIVASEKVNDYALKEAAYLVDLLLAKRPDVKAAMIKSGSRLCVLAHNEFTTDVPEFAWLKPKNYWDARARGTGGSQTDPYCSCGEENLLAYPGDPYSAENILIHEFAHNIHLRGMVNVDPTFDRRLKETYDRAMTTGLWKGKYAATNHHEYFAEGVQSWFDNNRENDHDHNHVNTRDELLEYDPGLAAMCREVFGETKLVYTKPTTRLKDHLAGYDPTTAPKFVWPERLTEARREIREKVVNRSKQATGEPVGVSPRTDAKPSPRADAARLAKANEDGKNSDPLLSVDRLFASKDFDEESLGTFLWKKQGAGYFTFEAWPKRPAGEKPVSGEPPELRSIVWHDTTSDETKVIVPGESFIPADAKPDDKGHKQPLSVESFQFSDDESKLLIFTNSRRVWRQNTRGDYWLLDIAKRELKKLGGDAKPSSLMFAKFAPDASRIAFVRDNNLFVQNLADLSITPLTKDGSATLINGTSDWVYEEELDLRDGYRWSPDSRTIAFWQLDSSGVREFFLINNTDDSYSKPIGIRYPKVGEQNSAARIGVVSVDGGEPKWLEVPGDSRNHYLAQLDWTPDGKQVALQQFNRLQNTNRVMLADPATGATRTILTETDPAWLENENPFRWVKNGEQFVWISERDGWRRPYLAKSTGNTEPPPPQRITQEQFDMISLEAVDEANQAVYYAASPSDPTQRYLYRATLDGEKGERLTPDNLPGWNTYNISPDRKFAVHFYSSFSHRPTAQLISLPDHKHLRSLINNQKLCVTLDALQQTKAEFLRLDIGNDLLLDAWCLKPPGFDPAASKKYPLLIFVYGEPHGQTVRDAWNGKRGLWHWMLAQQGYVVASVDNRGTMSPRGREWRKVVHRQIGILHPTEQAAATREMLKRWPQVDPDRVGIWGWSGGGSSSLNAIFQFPDLYRTAIAVAPVPNQKMYDTIYQERYMGLPNDNADGYTRGSPITHAKNLKGNLLIVHGTGDDNCHYQGVELLMNELIAHNKPFSLMAYPNRSHSISEGQNTTRHLYQLMTNYLQQNLPTK